MSVNQKLGVKMNYKTYAEAKIANPDSEIVTTGKNWDYEKETIATFEVRVFDGDDDGAHIIADDAWVVCNPADYCSSLKEFLGAGFKLIEGDVAMTINCSISRVTKDSVDIWNHRAVNDNGFLILSAAALNGGCKIPSKKITFVNCQELKIGECIGVVVKSNPEWSIYNNNLPLCELTDEQAAMLFNAWRRGEIRQGLNNSGFCDLPAKATPWFESLVYRIKPKSERELFIDKSVWLMTSETERTMEQMFGAQFDSGARYKDLTQHFGENI